MKFNFDAKVILLPKMRVILKILLRYLVNISKREFLQEKFLNHQQTDLENSERNNPYKEFYSKFSVA